MPNQFDLLPEFQDESLTPDRKPRKRNKKAKSGSVSAALSIRTPTRPRAPSPFKDTASAQSSPAFAHHRTRVSEGSLIYHSPRWVTPTVPENVAVSSGVPPRAELLGTGVSRRITTQHSSDAALHVEKLHTTGSSAVRPVSTLGAAADELQSFWQYVKAETHPEQIYPKTDVVWGQTERDRVYNFLLHVPYQLERVMWYGCALCVDSFLACITTMPLRAIQALSLALLPFWRAPTTPGHALPPLLKGSQVFDLVCCILLALATWCLLQLDPGAIYFYIKDIISEFLKIHVVSTALELFDKILSNFGVDALEALSGTCTLWAQGNSARRHLHLLSDSLVVLLVLLLHATVLMCQAVLFSVAMTSKNSALLALLIASNFVEIKGTVYKRMDVTKLWAVACMDIVERMHLLVVLAFVVVEDLRSAGAWMPSPGLLIVCAQVVAGELVIDILKHAVLGKFNDIRPGVYREFMKDLSEKAYRSQSYSVHKHLGFHYLASVALGLRMAATLLAMSTMPTPRLVALVGGVWLVLVALKPCFGYLLKVSGFQYVRYYNMHYGATRVVGRVGAGELGSTKKGR